MSHRAKISAKDSPSRQVIGAILVVHTATQNGLQTLDLAFLSRLDCIIDSVAGTDLLSSTSSKGSTRTLMDYQSEAPSALPRPPLQQPWPGLFAAAPTAANSPKVFMSGLCAQVMDKSLLLERAVHLHSSALVRPTHCPAHPRRLAMATARFEKAARFTRRQRRRAWLRLSTSAPRYVVAPRAPSLDDMSLAREGLPACRAVGPADWGRTRQSRPGLTL